MFSDGLLYTDKQILYDQQELIDNSSVRTQGVFYKTCQVWWTIEKNVKRESGTSMLAARHDDEDGDDHYE